MKKTLIKNLDWILTLDEQGTRYRNGDILVEGREIKEIGENIQAADVDEVIDGKGKILLPGFVNTHHHTFQSLVRNIHIANGLKLEPWLAVVYDIFQEINPDVARAGTLIGLGELLKTGCTTSNDHFYAHPRGTEHLIDVQIEAAKDLGIRFHPTRGSLTVGKSNGSPHVPDTLVETTDEIINDCERLIQKYHNTDRFSMCQIGLAPCWPEFETKEILNATRELSEKYDVQCHSHLAESKGEFAFCKEKFGCTPVEFVQNFGWLGENYYYAHCVQLTDSDVKIMAETKTGVAHCPNSNMFLNSGVCRVPDLLELGGNISIGVDGAASNNASNMLTEIRNTYLVHQLTWGHRGPTAEQVLRIASVGGAKVLKRNDIGYLAPGMAADMVLFDWDQLQYAGGKNDPAACIVLSGDSKMVDTVLVNGEIVVKEGMLTMIDERETMDWVNKVGKEMLEKASNRQILLKKDL